MTFFAFILGYLAIGIVLIASLCRWGGLIETLREDNDTEHDVAIRVGGMVAVWPLLFVAATLFFIAGAVGWLCRLVAGKVR